MADPNGSRTDERRVGSIGRAHGVRGEVAVMPLTDEPDLRFAVGAALSVAPARGTQRQTGLPSRLTVDRTRWHQGKLLVTFAEIVDRTMAEALRGWLLTAQVDLDEAPPAEGEYWDRSLIGLEVRDHTGSVVGSIADVEHGPAQDLLVVRTATDQRWVPFVEALVPVVDLEHGFVQVADVGGLVSGDPE
ncbi:ribosome maturation factor RimM [Parenemella sanctibonifatiensis]|uniref:Ribosome maturation factor RimM n=1 Tax=Parenemella sanctibonifatiensis TaxID=2016505 RepID=A0A255EB95_9ACTN|nr:ribosome maturation factor RimM [Parenemella sanctibonifatiensis]OYN88191.1 ribosome maturation factor RimM [Parenemella sanctibonifatiensis]